MKFLLALLLVFSFSAQAGWHKKYCKSVVSQSLKGVSYWMKAAGDRAVEYDRPDVKEHIDSFLKGYEYDLDAVCANYNASAWFTYNLKGELNAIRWQYTGQGMRRVVWSVDTAVEMLDESDAILYRYVQQTRW